MINKIIEIIKFFYFSINVDKRKKINYLIILMTISSIMEFLSIGSIIPLISTFLNYDFAKSSNVFIKIFYNYFSNSSNFQEAKKLSVCKIMDCNGRLNWIDIRNLIKIT